MWYAVVALILVLLAGLAFWWLKNQAREKEHQILSVVALLKGPQRLEPIYIASAAKKAWNATLSYSDEEKDGPDGYVVGDDSMPTMIVNFRERMLIVNNFPQPYMENPQEISEGIADLRLKKLVADHTAWLSCDAIGVESFDDVDEIREWYKTLGRLLAELVDDNCLAIFIPHTNQLFPNMDETLELLKADDPLQALGFDAPGPVLQIGADDPRMIAAVEKAKSTWPNFVSAFERKAGENFSVKVPITAGGNTEFIWLKVTAIENGIIYGELANEPVALGNLKLGSKAKSRVADLSDWAYVSNDGPVGMYTAKVIAQANKKT